MFYLPMGIIMKNSLVHEIISITEEPEIKQKNGKGYLFRIK